MATSTIPAVKAALVDQLSALTVPGGDLEGVSVTWGVPHTRPSRDWLMVGNVSTNQSDASFGQQKRDEEYTIALTISIVRSLYDDQRATTERAYDIAAVVEELVRPLTQPPLGVANLIWILVTKTDLAERFNENEREAEVSMTLSVKARI